MPKLTKTTIDNAKPGTSDVWLWDSEVPGFGIRIQPSGRKTYVTRYRTIDGTQRKHTVGRCSDMPPDRARDLARKVFANVAEGKDPTQQRRDAKEAPTVEDLRDRFMREHARPFKKSRSADLDENNWRLHIIPEIGKKKVRALTQADILALHGGLSIKPAVANQVLALLSKALNLAEVWGWRDKNSNPCKGVKKYKIAEKELILTLPQIGALNRTLEEMVEEHAISKALAALIRLLMLTGCRLTEIMHAERAWVDESRMLLLLPDSKVGQRRIPLSQPCLDVIGTLDKDSKWLIPGRVTDEPMQSPYKQWGKIKKRAGLPHELRLHDLRHTAGSLAHMNGMTQKQIAELLGHRQLSTTERYLHGFVGDRARVANTLANVITQNWGGQHVPA